MYADFNRFTIVLTKEQARTGSHQGKCDDDIAELLKLPKIRRQLDKIPMEDIASELREYGVWDETELQNDEENRARILWIACGNIVDEIRN